MEAWNIERQEECCVQHKSSSRELLFRLLTLYFREGLQEVYKNALTSGKPIRVYTNAGEMHKVLPNFSPIINKVSHETFL